MSNIALSFIGVEKAVNIASLAPQEALYVTAEENETYVITRADDEPADHRGMVPVNMFRDFKKGIGECKVSPLVENPVLLPAVVAVGSKMLLRITSYGSHKLANELPLPTTKVRSITIVPSSIVGS